MRPPNAPPGLPHHPEPELRGTTFLYTNRHTVFCFTALLCGIPLSRGNLWGRTNVRGILTYAAYTGTLLWGVTAKDNANPIRLEKAFPSIVSKAQFRRLRKRMSSRAPNFSHPRRVESSYLLSGPAKCKTCNTPLTGKFAKRGQYSYYVCQSNIKLGNGTCKTPTLNSHRFEELVAPKIRSNDLTEDSTRELVEEMDGGAREQRKTLRTIEAELVDVRPSLERSTT